MRLKRAIYRALGQRPPVYRRVGIEALERNWSFRRSMPDGVTILIRLLVMRGRVPAPASRALIPITPAPRWIVYFIYLPSGGLTAAHRYTLERLHAADARLAVICATPDGDVPAELHHQADALYWKGLGGFDFSAYALALHEVAERSSGADVFVLNDSVFGPFVPLDSLWPAMRWDLTGFTASAELENHIQSYAFHLKNCTRGRLRRLRAIFPRHSASDTYRDAVYSRESRFAAQAARSMTVGSLWYADNRRAGDPSVFAALPLLNAGFPFLKRSLLGKNARFYGPDEVPDRLRSLGHPVDEIVLSGTADTKVEE
ncbi:rhamnan synthesis F family protein [Sphingomonas mollis]|uniref:Rhamnan synthesis protein F n=1 Tax=Sphingomonas mollis TaxID=2795726 RepID=A0ABS0XTI3_9SPHN|nr:rhamnan synthesis F family protein [Sphingomonas sp. BT553]MBJ6123338.1 hypothetical protein [Sphingomonas sp. BT553]